VERHKTREGAIGNCGWEMDKGRMKRKEKGGRWREKERERERERE
jgi:hypothetical protein